MVSYNVWSRIWIKDLILAKFSSIWLPFGKLLNVNWIVMYQYSVIPSSNFSTYQSILSIRKLKHECVIASSLKTTKSGATISHIPYQIKNIITVFDHIKTYSISCNPYLHVSNIQILPNISSDDVSQLVQISQVEVRMVTITSLYIFIDSERWLIVVHLS